MMSHSAAVRSARQSALAGAIALAAAGVAPSAVSAQIPTTRASATTPAATRPAGPAAYRAIADEAEANLTDQVIDRWFPRAVDEANGGFLESFGPDWSPGENDSKAIVFQSRLTWVAAKMAGRDPDRAEQFKAWARHGVAFLSDEMWDGANGGPYWSVDNAGDPTTDRGTEKHAYGIAFGIYAASAAYEATGDPAALDFAKKSFAWLDAHAHDDDDGGYFEPLTADGTPILSPPDGADGPQQDVLGTRYGLKTMNSHIHLLEAFTGLYEAWPDPAVRGRLEEVFGLVRDRILVGSIGFQNSTSPPTGAWCRATSRSATTSRRPTCWPRRRPPWAGPTTRPSGRSPGGSSTTTCNTASTRSTAASTTPATSSGRRPTPTRSGGSRPRASTPCC